MTDTDLKAGQSMMCRADHHSLCVAVRCACSCAHYLRVVSERPSPPTLTVIPGGRRPCDCDNATCQLDTGDPKHGRSGYRNLGCRCPICRAANTADGRGWRGRRDHGGPGDRYHLSALSRTHGIRATYTAGCRCAECCEAERTYKANYRRKGGR